MTRKSAKRSFLVAAIVLTCIVGIIYWLYSQLYISTDNAYINANVTHISPRVTGQVAHLYVKDNQLVKKGQLLFDLDTASFQAIVDQEKAQLIISNAKLELAKITEARTLELVKKKVASEQEGDTVAANLHSALAAVELSKANLTQAELNLFYTKVYAPDSGWVTKVTLREGDVVTANQPLFALISDAEFWVDANFKETQIKKIYINQPVDIKVDMYPNYSFKGVVESISGGSGTAFSLLPPENATGNWVKVTQRVPVRVKVLNIDSQYPLRIGTSATVTMRIK